MNLTLKIKKSEIPAHLLIFALFLQIFYYYINGSYFSKFFPMGLFTKVTFILTVAILLFISVYQKSVTKKMLILTGLMIVIIALVGWTSDDMKSLIVLLLFLINSDLIEEERLLRFCAICNIIMLVIVVLSSQVGIIPNEFHFDPNYGFRYYLGFTFYITPNIMLFITLMCIAYRKEKITIIEILALLLANYFFFKKCNVRSSFWLAVLTLLLVLILSIYNRYFKRAYTLNRFFRIVGYAVFPICLIITYSMPLFYMWGFGFAQKINILTTNRIAYEAYAYQNYGVHLLGQTLTFNNFTQANFNRNITSFYIDSAFVRYLFMYGAILMGIIYYGYFKYIDALIKRNDIYYLIAVLATLIHFITGSQMFNIVYNPFIIFLLSFTYMKRKSNETKV